MNMKEKVSQIFKSTFGIVFVGIALFVALLVHLWLLFSHYIGIVHSFEMLGYDQRPLSDDRLFGWVFEAFLLGNATLSELYAGAIVFALGFSLVVSCSLVTQLITHVRDRAIFLRTGDNNSAKNIEITICYSILPWLALLIPLTAVVTMWDVKLFSFRAFAGVMGYGGPETAMSLENFGTIIAEHDDKFSMGVTRFSSFGYAAAIIITSLLLEFIFMKFRDRWDLLLDAFAGLFVWEEANTQQVISQPQAGSSTVGNAPAIQSQDLEETVEDVVATVPSGEVSRGQTDSLANETENTSLNVQEDTDDVAAIQQTGFDMDEEVDGYRQQWHLHKEVWGTEG